MFNDLYIPLNISLRLNKPTALFVKVNGIVYRLKIIICFSYSFFSRNNYSVIVYLYSIYSEFSLYYAVVPSRWRTLSENKGKPRHRNTKTAGHSVSQDDPRLPRAPPSPPQKWTTPSSKVFASVLRALASSLSDAPPSRAHWQKKCEGMPPRANQRARSGTRRANTDGRHSSTQFSGDDGRCPPRLGRRSPFFLEVDESAGIHGRHSESVGAILSFSRVD